jgi:hypothetical protein
LVCGISTQIANTIEGLDIILKRESREFKSSGLFEDSVIRISYLSVIPENFHEGKIGRISNVTLNLIIDRFYRFLKRNP